MNIVEVDEVKCTGCDSCVRICPISDANIVQYNSEGKLIININEDKCIRCGSCISACSHNARYFNDDTERFFNDLKRGEKIIIIAPPAIKVAFGEMWKRVLWWFRENGAESVYDVSFGADICTWAYLKYIEANKGSKVISQPCPAIVNYALRVKKELLKFLAPIQSPMMCMAIYIKKYLNKNYKIAALSPCIAKKDEFLQTGNIIEYNITFENLKKYFDKNGVRLYNIRNTEEFTFDGEQGGLGSVYSRPSGLEENILKRNPNLNVISFEGISRVYKVLDKYSKENYSNLPDVFDVLNCEYGCNSGPVIGQEHNLFKTKSYMNEVDKYVKAKIEENQIEEGDDKQFKEFDEKLNLEDFMRQYKTYESTTKTVTKADIDKAFDKLLKKNDVEKNFDCCACGFDTCYDMAVAIAKGINIPEKCYQFIMKKVNIEHDYIESVNDNVFEIIKQLENIFSNLNENIENVKQDSEVINELGRRGYEQMNKVNEYMHKLIQVGKDMQKKVSDINQEAVNYKIVTDSVEDVADNINLLSFNASIEAARAGEYGKGFAVIASSIRELSINSKRSVVDANVHNEIIHKTINDIINSINEFDGKITELMDLVNGTMKNVKNTSESVKLINSSMNDIKELSDKVYSLIEKSNNILDKH